MYKGNVKAQNPTAAIDEHDQVSFHDNENREWIPQVSMVRSRYIQFQDSYLPYRGLVLPAHVQTLLH
jgi:hypothetical protein